MTEATPTELIEQFRDGTEAVWNHGKLDVLDGAFADDVVVHEIPTGNTYGGLDEVKEWVEGVRAGFPDFALDAERTTFFAAEGRIVSQWVVTGTHEGSLPGIDAKPTGQSVELTGVTLYEVDDGVVTEAWWYYDMLSMLDQLGLVPAELPT